jgi:hypothetical protein
MGSIANNLRNAVRPVSAFTNANKSPNQAYKFHPPTERVVDDGQISINEKGGGIIRKRMGLSMGNFSEQSTDANYIKVNKKGIVKNWVADRFTQYEAK